MINDDNDDEIQTKLILRNLAKRFFFNIPTSDPT